MPANQATIRLRNKAGWPILFKDGITMVDYEEKRSCHWPFAARMRLRIIRIRQNEPARVAPCPNLRLNGHSVAEYYVTPTHDACNVSPQAPRYGVSSSA